MTHQMFRPDVAQEFVIHRSIELSAPVARVWRALTVAEEIARWFPTGTAQLDLAPGGTGILTWTEGYRAELVVEALEEPSYLAWTWGHEDGGSPVTLVEFRLRPADGTAGGTVLTVTESGIRTPETFTDNSAGWDTELGELAAFLTQP